MLYMKNLKLNLFALSALVVTLSASFANAAMKSATMQPLAVYHISNIAAGDIYTVTTDGSCTNLATDPACQFSTTLAPDQPGGKFSRAFLLSHGVVITNGTYSPL